MFSAYKAKLPVDKDLLNFPKSGASGGRGLPGANTLRSDFVVVAAFSIKHK